ncbi:cold-shock protein [Methanobrevibacter sp.]|uniref:cold-shock protein n=1 Tax=Methanobrevibacter sp. TaxID=66852 RepID=UPI003863DEB7
MNSEFKVYLNNARDLKQSGNFIQALEIYEEQYNQHSEEFKYAQKVDYAWTIIKVRMLNPKDDKEFFEAADCITELLPQADLNKRKSCPYTSAVFKVLIKLKNDEDFIGMMHWLEKLNPELLDERPYRSYGRLQKPRREKYYDWLSKACLENMEFERCIEVSKTALDALKSFQDEGDTWFRWRIAKSLMQLNRFDEAIGYAKEVIKVKHKWYMYRAIAECYYILGKPYDALDYLCPAVLSSESAMTKVNLYLLCYRVFKSFNPEMALKHAQLFTILKRQKGHSLPYEIEKFDIDETRLNRKELESEIRELWIRYKFKDRKLEHGTIVKFIQEKSFGFIKCEDGDEIFFHKSEFRGGPVYVGQLVSFYVEESFDKSKGMKSLKAVNVRGE